MLVPAHIRDQHPGDRSGLLGRLARKSAVQSSLKAGLPAPSFQKASNGVPIQENGIFWSITHKPGAVGGVVSRRPVGMDIEVIKDVSSNLFGRIVSKSEAALFHGGEADEIFFRAFTAKEAVLKEVQVGLKGLPDVRICRVAGRTEMALCFRDVNFTVENFYFDNHVAAVTKNQSIISWTVE